MAGSMTTTGTEELSRMLGELGDKAPGIAAQALYEGAGVMANAYKAAAGRILTAPRRHREPGGRLPTPEEKAAVQGAVGIARFRKDGTEVDTIIGEPEGYANINGRQKPIKEIARSINSGTSFMTKQPVFRRASRASAAAAQAAMTAKAEELIKDITGG